MEKYEGMWDFSGSCAPGSATFSCETFSLGCFQWLKKADGKGWKKSAVRYRVKGMTADPEPTFEAARKYCEKKNKQ